jgi:SMI1 / KNR4 family (SUKH-1)
MLNFLMLIRLGWSHLVDLQQNSALGFDRLLARMATSAVAEKRDLRGCTADEIASLESRYRLSLPKSYRRYLELMGHQSGRMFTSDHLAVFYKHVRDMTADFRVLRTGLGHDRYAGNITAPENFQLPPDALLIAGRLDAAWQFIRCSDVDDSPVWIFNEGDWNITQTNPSVVDWLNTWCGIAEDAIASGYFRENPAGTAP